MRYQGSATKNASLIKSKHKWANSVKAKLSYKRATKRQECKVSDMSVLGLHQRERASQECGERTSVHTAGAARVTLNGYYRPMMQK